MINTTIVFLFNADLPNSPCAYGDIFDSAFLRSVSKVDPRGRTNSAILRGDLLLHRLATIAEPFLFEGRYTANREVVDRDLFTSLAWDFVDAMTLQWHTMDLSAMADVLLSHNVYCLCLPSVDADVAAGIDENLRDVRGYVGALDVDLGNPFQYHCFVGALIEDAVLASGQVLLARDDEDETPFEGAEEFEPGGRRFVREGSLSTFRPALAVPNRRSERGQEAVRRYRLQLRGSDARLDS